MSSQSQEAARREPGWTIGGAEDLLQTLPGVISVRVVARPGGEIDEIHVLTSEEVRAKQTVRNVESALLAHFDLPVDHRKISVAQSKEGADADAPVSSLPERSRLPEPAAEPPRIVFVSHQVETEESHRIRARVSLAWGDRRASGEATGSDLLRPRLEALASATLRSIEELLGPSVGEGEDRFGLGLDGVKTTEAFDRTFMLVAVHAIHRRDIVSLAGASVVEETPERAVILATLQATDRWARGRI